MVFRFIQIRFKENSNGSKYRRKYILDLFRTRRSQPAQCGLTEFPLIKIIPIWVWRPEPPWVVTSQPDPAL